MDWLRRWLGIEKPSTRDFEDLAASAVTALADAQKAHISDLRLLIDKGNEREAQLAAMVKRALDHQFYRPVITGTAAENKMTVLAPEQMQDVTVFDEEVDGEQVRQQEKELSELIAEQNAQGAHKVEA